VNHSDILSNKKGYKKMNRSIDWDYVTAQLASGQMNKLCQFATLVNVSRPTAKKLLVAQYGTRICFSRGRTGGMLYAASYATPAPVPAPAPDPYSIGVR
jgi:hypothetical protein